MKINKNVLVVDDDAHIRRVIELKLKKAGYQVFLASNGEDGLNFIKTHQPDVVITDIIMPKMDGRTLCLETNALKKENPFLTLVITCSISFNEKLLLNEMQNTMFMEKPFSPSRLLDCIDNYFGIERS